VLWYTISFYLEQLYNGPLSFRVLGRRLKVNYKKLNKTLKLIFLKIIEVHTFKVGNSKSYHFYSLSREFEEILKKILQPG